MKNTKKTQKPVKTQKETVLAKIIGEFQKLEIGQKTSYLEISKNLGWKTHCGRTIEKEIIPHTEGILKKVREGKKAFYEIVGPVHLLSDILNIKSEVLKEKKVAKKATKKLVPKKVEIVTPIKSVEKKPVAKKSKKEKVAMEELVTTENEIGMRQDFAQAIENDPFFG